MWAVLHLDSGPHAAFSGPLKEKEKVPLLKESSVLLRIHANPANNVSHMRELAHAFAGWRGQSEAMRLGLHRLGRSGGAVVDSRRRIPRPLPYGLRLWQGACRLCRVSTER